MLNIIDICEVCEILSALQDGFMKLYHQDKLAVEQKVKELHAAHPAYTMMVIIMDNVTAKNGEGSDEVIVKAANAEEYRTGYQGCSGVLNPID